MTRYYLQANLKFYSSREGIGLLTNDGEFLLLSLPELLILETLKKLAEPFSLADACQMSSVPEETLAEAFRDFEKRDVISVSRPQPVDQPLARAYHQTCCRSIFLDYRDKSAHLEDVRRMDTAYKDENGPSNSLIPVHQKDSVSLDISSDQGLGDFLVIYGRKPPKAAPYSLENLQKFLKYTIGKRDTYINRYGKRRIRRFIPSGGNNHPCNTYVIAEIRKDGFECFYFNPIDSTLVPTGKVSNFAEVVEKTVVLLNRLPFVPKFVLLHTWTPTRAMFRYNDERTYRVLNMDLGHLFRHIRHVAASMGWDSFTGYEPVCSALSHLTLCRNQLEEPIVGATLLGIDK